MEYAELFAGKTILVTGGTGSVGKNIVKRLLQYEPKAIRILSRGESKQFKMQHQLGDVPILRYLVGDVAIKND